MPTPSNLLLASLSAHVMAAIIPVSVGRAGLNFDPAEIRGHMGDVIEFRFWPRNHSVVAGNFENACQPAEDGGFFSGFFPTAPNTVNNQVFRVAITHNNPVPIYCSQNNGQHCKNGMVAVINPGDSGSHTLNAYHRLAGGAGNATSPSGGPFGGEVAQMEGGQGTQISPGSSTSVTTLTTGGPGETSSTTTGTETGTAAATGTPQTSNGADVVAAPAVRLLVAAAAAVFV
ncbi:hypothetical protein MMYC01_207178 [Madurella mycetomatis]|uniref:Extracellular serine-rich protein n=1 Tax=Madurella mycetomatis TaxID=100816 RepID=A0A175VZ41_9PEZI|nr:hypothetical protein MMYC01_207178 [Madurella mycetomatis]